MGKWEPVASMCLQRSRFGAAVLGGRIYAVGGFDPKYKRGHGHDLSWLTSVERYDPEAGQWEEAAELGVKRSRLAVAVM